MSARELREQPVRDVFPSVELAPSLVPYRTNNLHFASWLIVENLLTYDHCTTVGRRVMFFFQDPESRGPGLQAQWLSSNPLVPQKTLVEILRMLRTEMTTVLRQGGSHENPA